jgi:hypothetical protein
MVRAGETFNCEEGYFRALKKNGLVELATAQTEPGPSRDRNIPQAPGRGGKEQPGGQGNPPVETTVPTRDGGKVLTSASLQAGPASRRKTLLGSVPGARKGTSTPRKPKATPPPAG